MRWLLALLILIATSDAEAFPLRGGGGSSNACGSYVNGSTPGDTICISTPSLSINDVHYGTWQFSGLQGSCPVGQGTFSTQPPTYPTCATKMEFCNPFGSAGTTGLDSFQIGASFLALMQSNGQLLDSISFCAPPLGYFLDGVTAYNSAQDSISAATAGDTLTWRAPPAALGAAGWQYSTTGTAGTCISTASLTINMVAFGGNPFVTTPGGNCFGQAPILINANNITMNGGRLIANLKATSNSLNPIIENMTISDATGPNAFASSCVLTGGQNGTVVLANDLIFNCGDNNGAGQNHNVYVSAQGGSSVVDHTCYTISGLTSLNVLYAGHSAKLRPPCDRGQGDVTNSVIGCTLHGNITGASGCNQNAVIDFPCGGNHKVEHSVLEAGDGQGIYNQANWYIMKYGEELPFAANCPGGDAGTNVLVFDHDIFIEDNTTATAGYTCLVTQFGGGPPCSMPAGTSCTITNSQIISNTPAMGIAITIAPCTDGGGNSFYASRAAALAAAASGWSNGATYTDPISGTVYNCCAFPYLPPHL